ncbi:MAG: Fic family protein [Atopococcus tabaci]|uniref:Fic family protein n=1 Tax=Atopococcus tabaci TaxID=269774 RepID=A0AA43UDF0_9LACT|nr:Fic family protein [Atopococcus tabaci]
MTNFSPDYIDDILVRMAYHNSAIEGNTITLPETVSIILEGTTPGNKSVREFYEIENHKEAFHYIFNLYADSEKLSIPIVKDIHSLLLDRLQHDRGQFKTSQNAIVGAEFKTASPEETLMLMDQWVDNTNYQLEHSASTQDKLNILAESHLVFERIHPFSDGNGRTGRMVLMYQSLLEFGLPIVINNNTRASYIQSLANQDVDSLSGIFHDSMMYEKERIENFNS